jgi:hypothetical protein
MPNGRSGGFSISRYRLRELLEDLPRDASIGMTVAALSHGRESSTSPAAVSAEAVAELVDRFQQEHVWIEEQDQSFYIVHLDPFAYHGWGEPNPNLWIMVRSHSPLFEPLRQLHHR